MVQIAFSDPEGKVSLLEAYLSKDSKGYYLNSNGYGENSRNWPSENSQIIRIDQLAVAGNNEFAKINLMLNPQNVEQAFRLSAGTAISVDTDKNYIGMFVVSVGTNGLINAVELTSAGPLPDSYYRINEQGELLRMDLDAEGGRDEFKLGKIKAVNRSNCSMRFDFRTEQAGAIEIRNPNDGTLVRSILPYELIQRGTEVKISFIADRTQNETEDTGIWQGVQSKMIIMSDKNNLNLRLIPLAQVTKIDNFGAAYKRNEDLAVLLSPKTEASSSAEAFSVELASKNRSGIPFASGTRLFTVAKK